MGLVDGIDVFKEEVLAMVCPRCHEDHILPGGDNSRDGVANVIKDVCYKNPVLPVASYETKSVLIEIFKNQQGLYVIYTHDKKSGAVGLSIEGDTNFKDTYGGVSMLVSGKLNEVTVKFDAIKEQFETLISQVVILNEAFREIKEREQ